MSDSYFSRVLARRRQVRARAGRCLRFENLEGRAMMSAAPVSLESLQLAGPVAEPLTVQTTPTTGTAGAVLSSAQLEQAQAANQLVDGGIVTGRIRRAQQQDQWFFRTAARNETIELTAKYETGNSELRVTVFGPGGRVVRQWRGWQDVRLNLNAAGRYTVRVEDASGRNGGAYKIGFERISRPSADARNLVDGGITTGRIRESLQKDQLTFSTTARNEVVELTARYTTGNSELRVTVFDSQGAVVREWRGWQNIRLTLPNAGRYLVKVQDAQLLNTGSYCIGFERINPPSHNVRSLAEGGIIHATIRESLQKEQFTLQTTGRNEIVELTARYATGNSQLRVTVFDSQGAVVREWRGWQNIRLTLPNAGRYLVQVQDAQLLNTGSYSIGFERINPPSRNARNLAAGAVFAGRIQEPMQKDQVTIQTTQNNQVVEVRGRYTTGNSQLRVIVFDARGAVVREWRGSHAIRLTLPSAGRYLIQVQDAVLLNVGSYDLVWRRV